MIITSDDGKVVVPVQNTHFQPIEVDDATQLNRANQTGYRLILNVTLPTEEAYLAATQAIRAGTLK